LTAADARSLRNWLMAGQAGWAGRRISWLLQLKLLSTNFCPSARHAQMGDAPGERHLDRSQPVCHRLPAERLKSLFHPPA